MATDNANVTPELPPLIPPPRSIEKVDGTTTLSSDVRLSTRDVLPYMRKGMRGIFTAADIRVVANKKKFIIEVHIVEESEVKLDDIPEALRDDAYEMDIIDNLVTVRSASQMGAAWGVQTFADIYMSAGHETVIPNVKIRDWSSTPLRGFFMPCTPALERMRYDEFTSVVDRVARLKCNTLGVELFRQHLSPFPACSVVKDSLLVPLHEEEPPDAQACSYAWFNPDNEAEEVQTIFPPLIEAQGLSKLVAYTIGKGLQFVPGLSLPAKSLVLPAVLPAVRGENSTGGEAQDICCLTSDGARNAYEQLLDTILAQGFEEPPAYFLLNLDSTPPTDDPRHWCQCKDCKAQAPDEIVGGFITWFTETLTAKGVKKLILFQTDPHPTGQALTSEVMKTLTGGELADKIVFRLTQADKTDKEASLVASSVAFGAGAGFNRGFTGLLEDVKTAVDQKACGILAGTRPDALSHIAESVLALNAWAGMITDSEPEAIQYVTSGLAPEAAAELNTAVQTLNAAGSAVDLPAALLRHQVLTRDLPPAALAAEVLRLTEQHGGKDLQNNLETALTKGDDAAAKLDKLLVALTPPADEKSDDEAPPTPPAYVQSMRGEAAFIKAVANYFLAALPCRQELSQDPVPDDALKALKAASQTLKTEMAAIPVFKSRCAAAADLCTLSALLV